MGNLQILLKSPEILPWKWVWSSWSVLIQNNFFKFSISQHLESFIHYFIHQLSSRLLRGHWQQNVHLNWCHSIFSFFTNFQLSVNRQKYFDWSKTELVLLCWWFRSWTNHCSFNRGRRTQFPNGILNHSTRHANYDLSPFHHFIFISCQAIWNCLWYWNVHLWRCFSNSHFSSSRWSCQSSVKSGPQLKMHRKKIWLIVCRMVLRWVCKPYATRPQFTCLDVPFESPISSSNSHLKLSSQIGLVGSSTHFFLNFVWRTIFVVPFSFFYQSVCQVILVVLTANLYSFFSTCSFSVINQYNTNIVPIYVSSLTSTALLTNIYICKFYCFFKHLAIWLLFKYY